MIKREISNRLKELARQYPVVLVTGPRQSGKTTLCKFVFSKKDYVLFETPAVKEYAVSDPQGFLAKYPNGAIFDEIQKVPDLIAYIQGIVDEKNRNGLYILTGSQNLLLSSKINQSLAGRVAVVKLLPFSFRELRNQSLSANAMMLKGFYPRIYDKNLNPFEAMSFYFQTYVERDIRDLIHLKDALKFQNFVKLCAGRIGQLLNLSSLGNEAGISHQTAHEWISLLEVSYIIFRLPPYHKNFSKRIIKMSKLYFYDVGLASYLLGIENISQVERDPLKGALFENMIVADILKGRFNKVRESNLSFFRDSNGNEVDIIAQTPRGLVAIEIKSGETIVPDFFRGLDYFERIAAHNLIKKYIVYGGEDKQLRSKAQVLSYKNCHEIKEI
ncbi:MAG: ATP-binding protein [Elusimicrobia bacterium]|nr:ATP-binding protein [Elusimicrobiota bacterium]